MNSWKLMLSVDTQGLCDFPRSQCRPHEHILTQKTSRQPTRVDLHPIQMACKAQTAQPVPAERAAGHRNRLCQS